MRWRHALVVLCAVGTLLSAARSQASVATCRKKSAAKAASLYAYEAKSILKCSQLIAAGKPCAVATRDAKLAVALGKAQTSVLAACPDVDAAGLGFASNDPLAVRVAGAAAGAGRQVVDAVFQRDPAPLATTLGQCAKNIATAAIGAGKLLVKQLGPCGTGCTPTDVAKVDAAYTKAAQRIASKCAPGDVAALVGGDGSAYLGAMRAGAQRVVGAFAPGAGPVVSLAAPAPATILTPPGLPASVPIEALVSNVPHAGYVNTLTANGLDTTFDPGNGRFDRTLSINTPRATVPVVLTARTTLGTVSGIGTLRFNLASVAPGVIITSPVSGTITGGSSITVSGQIIGNLGAADLFTVAGVPVGFDPGTGAFSTSVAVGPGAVNVVRATVQSLGLGTTDSDSVVVLKGTAWPLGARVPSANFNRMNNSGLNDARNIVKAQLDAALAPANFIGMEAGGGTIDGFSVGSSSAQVFGGGANTVVLRLSINNFHLHVDDVGPFGLCSATYDAANVLVEAHVDLVGQLQASITTTSVTFTNDGGSLDGACSLLDFLADVRSEVRGTLTSEVNSLLGDALDDALAGINVSGPIGAALDVLIDAIYASIPEDNQGITFLVDSNVVALAPIPDAPAITATLLPTPAGNPVLGPTIPSTAIPYDLGFCLSDGFVNRAMAAFMLQGRFNQSLTAIPIGGNTLPLTTTILSALTGDTSYTTACNNCPVTLALKPTAAAVARAPLPAENATVTLTIPNYRVDLVAQNGPTPVPLITANVTFDLPITLGVAAGSITPTVGAIAVSDVKVTVNSIGANETSFGTQVGALFPLAAQALGGLFGEITLPSVAGLSVSGAGSAYNVSCAGIYLNLN